MAPPSEIRDFTSAWRALSDCSEVKDGWRTIPVVTRLMCSVFAGRHFPGNEEAIIIGFPANTSASNRQLPEGHGFLVSRVDNGPDHKGDDWFALVRQHTGNLELFTIMTSDIISNLEKSEEESPEAQFEVFLERIRAWQRFMQRCSDGLLTPEAEIGLYGELVILSSILAEGVAPHRVTQAWWGPRDGLHDFQIGTGAIEVKTTTSQAGFLVNISSLDQLDNRLALPLYLAGVRLRPDDLGMSLGQLVEKVRGLLEAHGPPSTSFDLLLLGAGYAHQMSTSYTRRFAHSGTVILPVDDDFPKLNRMNVPAEILEAKYILDLDRFRSQGVFINEALRSLGVLQDGTC